MATIPTATIIPGPKFTLTPQSVIDAKGLFMFGNTDPDNASVGGFSVRFDMSQDWIGTIAFIGRNALHKAGVDDIGLVGPWPFRAFYLNGLGWDGSMISDLAARSGGTPALITNTSEVFVAAYGVTIGLNVQCTRGSCTMYYLPLFGQSSV